DFWVVEEHLRAGGREDARRAWWDVAARNRLHDSMVLDMLIRLARDDAYPVPRDLAAVAQSAAGLSIRKDDPYRMRYGEIVGAACPDLYKLTKGGELIIGGKAKGPKKRMGDLRAHLTRVREEVRRDAGVELEIPLTAKARELSTSGKVWGEYRDLHPFVADWL